MVLYNVTIKIDKSAEREWLDFMENNHIPDILATGHFTGYRLCRLLDQPSDDDPTYVVQYEARNIEQVNLYQAKEAPVLRAEFDEKFKNRFVAFRTMMEVL